MNELETLMAILGNASSNGNDKKNPDLISNPEFTADYVRRYHDHTPLKPGDVVVWKDGMKDRKFPDYGEECMVLDVFEPMRCKTDCGSTIYGEVSDMRLIFFKEDADNPQMPMPFAYNSHMFRKVR